MKGVEKAKTQELYYLWKHTHKKAFINLIHFVLYLDLFLLFHSCLYSCFISYYSPSYSYICFYEWKWNISFVIFAYNCAIEMLWFIIRLMYTKSMKVPWHQREYDRLKKGGGRETHHGSISNVIIIWHQQLLVYIQCRV